MLFPPENKLFFAASNEGVDHIAFRAAISRKNR
jgi:hypothetical protein